MAGRTSAMRRKRGALRKSRAEMKTTSTYNQQQISTIRMVHTFLAGLAPSRLGDLEESIAPYLRFRDAVDRFQKEYFSGICTRKCFTSGNSACCGREGILTFFADVAVSVLLSSREEVDALLEALEGDRGGPNCVYLREEGCLWRLKPVVCEMFLCDEARKHVLEGNAALANRWEGLRRQERLFTLPTQPVLFDELESLFIDAGLESPLMYCHLSPGLLRLKARHGLGGQRSPGRKSCKG